MCVCVCVCSAVTGHFTEVIIQNVHICNSNVPVTILREKTLKVVNRTASEVRQIFRQVQSLKRCRRLRDFRLKGSL